jgi:hypothetical protein
VDIAQEDQDMGVDTELLDEAECLDLLPTVRIGRIAFTQDALPAVQPVSFAVLDGEVLIPTHRGSKVAAASRRAVVAFEVDEFDVRDRTGWSVTVVGQSRLIVDVEEVRRIDRLDVQPWVHGPDGCYIGVQVRLVSGRRIRRPPAVLEEAAQQPDGQATAVLPA